MANLIASEFSYPILFLRPLAPASGRIIYRRPTQPPLHIASLQAIHHSLSHLCNYALQFLVTVYPMLSD